MGFGEKTFEGYAIVYSKLDSQDFELKDAKTVVGTFPQPLEGIKSLIIVRVLFHL